MTTLLLLVLLWLLRFAKVTATKITLDEVRHRATLTIEETAALLGVSRGVAYEAARRGDLPVLSLGARRLICAPRLLRLIGAESLDEVDDHGSDAVEATMTYPGGL